MQIFLIHRTKNVLALLEKNYRIHCSMNNKVIVDLKINYLLIHAVKKSIETKLIRTNFKYWLVYKILDDMHASLLKKSNMTVPVSV